jgi:sialic acid synthase SpsE
MLKIGKKIINKNNKPYIIAEACINHEGNINIAKKMVKLASAAGASAIKFQMHVLDDEMLRKTPRSKNFKESLYDALKRTNLNVKQHIYLKKYCQNNSIDYLCTPFSRKSADVLYKEVKVNVFKIGSGELTNLPLQIHIAKKKLPTIISTGMSSLKEVKETFNQVYKINKKIALTQCTSIYPCPSKYSDIGVVKDYIKKFKIPVGLSDHTDSIYTSLGAVALGACIIEKHFTLNKKARGPDHASSIEPHELKQLVEGANAIFEARNEKKRIHKKEFEIIKWARESVVTTKDIKKGEILSEQNISVKRPAPKKGIIPAKSFRSAIGKRAKLNLRNNKQLKWAEII